MAEVVSLSCDVCHAQPADKWNIQMIGERAIEVDLCTEHAKPIRDVAVRGRQATGGRGTKRTKRVVGLTERARKGSSRA